jgi:excisionase family DNA binding protein
VSRVRNGAALLLTNKLLSGNISVVKGGVAVYTIQEVADMFRVTRKTIYQWINAGKLNIIKIERTIRIEQSEIDRIKKGE